MAVDAAGLPPKGKPLTYCVALNSFIDKVKGGWTMPHCHEMKKGQIYACGDCGLKLQVIEECTECVDAEGECAHEECEFTCCDTPMTLVE